MKKNKGKREFLKHLNTKKKEMRCESTSMSALGLTVGRPHPSPALFCSQSSQPREGAGEEITYTRSEKTQASYLLLPAYSLVINTPAQTFKENQ